MIFFAINFNEKMEKVENNNSKRSNLLIASSSEGRNWNAQHLVKEIKIWAADTGGRARLKRSNCMRGLLLTDLEGWIDGSMQ